MLVCTIQASKYEAHAWRLTEGRVEKRVGGLGGELYHNRLSDNANLSDENRLYCSLNLSFISRCRRGL
jgi:hypothetical protein